MVRSTLFSALLASSALACAVAAPAHAGERDRAREAIAAAEAKLHTAETLGSGVEVPAATAEARASLARAHEDFKTYHSGAAIDEAIRAQALADTAIGELQRQRNASLAAAHHAEQAGIAAAQAQASSAEQRAASAEQQASSAQQQVDQAHQEAEDAKARAAAAEQAAAASAADAEAARAAAATTAAQQTQVQTTVTTRHHHASAHHVTRARTVHRTARSGSGSTDEVTATTTVTPH